MGTAVDRAPSKVVRVGLTLSPETPPGADLMERVGPDKGPSAVARRDLERYYALLRHGLRRLRGRFGVEELEAMAYALSSMAEVENAELLHLAPAEVLESVRYERLCEQAGLDEERCSRFRDTLGKLDPLSSYVLVDAVGRYLVRREKEGVGGEELWKQLGLL